MRYPGFVGPSNQAQSPVADCERLVNYYVEPNDAGTGRPALYPTPGFAPFVTVMPDVSGRALRQMNNRTLGVIGQGIYELFSNGAYSRYGTVKQDGNQAQIEWSNAAANQALIASGTNGYLLNLTTNTATTVLTGDAYQIGMLDGYFIAFNSTTGKIRISAVNDGTSWDPTQFVSREQPDTWKAMIVRAPNIWLIGDLSADVWFNANNFPFPFAPRVGFTFYYGIAAPFSLAASARTVLWLSKNSDGAGLLIRADGYNLQPVGSYAFDTAMAQYQRDSTIADAEAMMLQWFGHTWYVLKFPTANHTWVYDLRTSQFFEVGHWNSRRGDWDAWSPRVTCLSFGKHLVGDNTAAISTLSDTNGLEANGDAIRRMRIPPALISENGSRVFVDRFELGLQSGLGLSFGQGSDPNVMVRWSPDFTRTWGNELQLGMGAQGQYSKLVFHTIAGSSLKSMVPEVTVSDPIPSRIVGASVLGRGIARATSP